VAGNPVGFFIWRGDELDQFYIAASARGSGIAHLLMADAEAFLAAAGVKVAWLACAVGNHRAARFYEKCGWRRAAIISHEAQTSSSPFRLEAWRYEKPLDPAPRQRAKQ
jgi:GNAT superfamily N-acetyltransferase